MKTYKYGNLIIREDELTEIQLLKVEPELQAPEGYRLAGTLADYEGIIECKVFFVYEWTTEGSYYGRKGRENLTSAKWPVAIKINPDKTPLQTKLDQIETLIAEIKQITK